LTVDEQQIGRVVLEQADDRYTIRIDIDRPALETELQGVAGNALRNWFSGLWAGWIGR
jgi:hypothetical protein